MSIRNDIFHLLQVLELLTGATTTLRREYLARLHIAREELASAAARLRERRTGQESGLVTLEQVLVWGVAVV